jgi:hypothetical protein
MLRESGGFMEEQDVNKMDAAAAVAADELKQIVAAMSPDEYKGALALVGWLKKHYLSAGYKRLNRSLLALLNPQK